MPHFRSAFVLAIALGAGCAGKNYNVSNPVLGPPPPRIASTQSEAKQTAEADTIQQTSYSEESPLPTTAVVARVNGRAILAGEILEQYSGKLKEYESKLNEGVASGQLSEANRGKQLRKAQDLLIQKDLDRNIEKVLMAQAVRARLKKEQLDSVNEQLNDFFEKEVVTNLKTRLEVNSTLELETMLQEQGTSLETMRQVFADEQLASQYIRTKIGDEPKPSRVELLAVYNKQIEKYSFPMQVKWQQLQISVTPARSKSQAEQEMQVALEAIASGMTFDNAVKKYSDGPLASNGGHWDWTQPGSVANSEVRQALETLKPGATSGLIVSPTSVQVIKVTERKNAGTQPLDEVQEEIRMQIIEEWREQRSKVVLAEVRKNAVIETIYESKEDLDETITR
ncbi:peptidylprolyl isomerase [Planctomicrobium sp. SH527]|uniref:peptidylprolyl isomerase n=1 Tax=Planctomicrobium sp. SH527 TaxID=3448123 RepID=UPI003F5B3B53